MHGLRTTIGQGHTYKCCRPPDPRPGIYATVIAESDKGIRYHVV